MPQSIELPRPVPASLTSLAELDRSLDAKGTAYPEDGLYPRDGVVSVTDIERQISAVTIPGQLHNVVWSSGMSAVRETVNFATVLRGRKTKRDAAPVVASAHDLYGQSLVYFTSEERRGIQVIRFMSGNEKDITALIEDRSPDVVFAETVANTPEIPVLNVHNLLDHIRSVDNPPIVILDNTLPLSTGINFAELLRPDDPVIVVESGTKNAMNNSDLLGISYSPNLALIEALRKHKAHSGAVNSLGGLQSLSDSLRLTLPEFHDRNRSVFSSTGRIALALAEAQAELGGQADFTTTFPTDPNHLNHDYAEEITRKGEDFPSPVVFIAPNDPSESAAANLIRRISEHPAISEQISMGEIHLGQSFGTPKARLLYDRKAPNVRFAGGFDLTDRDALAAAIKEALVNK